MVLYGTETWAVRKKNIKAPDSFEIWIWRRMEKISWTEYIAKKEVQKQQMDKYLRKQYKPTNHLSGLITS